MNGDRARNGERLHRCHFRLAGEPECGRPLPMYVPRCGVHQALLQRFWRELGEELAERRQEPA